MPGSQTSEPIINLSVFLNSFNHIHIVISAFSTLIFATQHKEQNVSHNNRFSKATIMPIILFSKRVIYQERNVKDITLVYLISDVRLRQSLHIIHSLLLEKMICSCFLIKIGNANTFYGSHDNLPSGNALGLDNQVRYYHIRNAMTLSSILC